MTTAGDVLTRLQEKLNDLDSVRWPDNEHFRAMNDAQQAILESRPDLFETYRKIETVAGSAQSVPSDCYRLFDVIANYDASDNPVGGITRVDRATLDRHRRDWITMSASATAFHWMQDEREWNRFYLVPGQPAANRGKVEIRFALRPTTVTQAGDNLTVAEEGINAVYNFCMHRALEKDEKFAGSPQSQSYMTKFAQFVAAKTKADTDSGAVRHENENS